eukprot:scaffold10873_cov96-Isochrysis_galbana.AAC.3
MPPRGVPTDSSGSAPSEVSPSRQSSSQLANARMATAPCFSSASAYHSHPSSMSDHGHGTGTGTPPPTPPSSSPARPAPPPSSHEAELRAARGTSRVLQPRPRLQRQHLRPAAVGIADQCVHAALAQREPQILQQGEPGRRAVVLSGWAGGQAAAPRPRHRGRRGARRAGQSGGRRQLAVVGGQVDEAGQLARQGAAGTLGQREPVVEPVRLVRLVQPVRRLAVLRVPVHRGRANLNLGAHRAQPDGRVQRLVPV